MINIKIIFILLVALSFNIEARTVKEYCSGFLVNASDIQSCINNHLDVREDMKKYQEFGFPACKYIFDNGNYIGFVRCAKENKKYYNKHKRYLKYANNFCLNYINKYKNYKGFVECAEKQKLSKIKTNYKQDTLSYKLCREVGKSDHTWVKNCVNKYEDQEKSIKKLKNNPHFEACSSKLKFNFHLYHNCIRQKERNIIVNKKVNNYNIEKYKDNRVQKRKENTCNHISTEVSQAFVNLYINLDKKHKSLWFYEKISQDYFSKYETEEISKILENAKSKMLHNDFVLFSKYLEKAIIYNGIKIEKYDISNIELKRPLIKDKYLKECIKEVF